MRIKCLDTFLDGKDRFEKDDVRTVDDQRTIEWPDEWFTEIDADGNPILRREIIETSAVTDLDVQNVALGHGVNHG